MAGLDTIYRVTNKKTWEDAQVAYPTFAPDERLKSFKGLVKGNHFGVPHIFCEYCQTAIRHTEEQQGEQSQAVNKDGHFCNFVQREWDKVTKSAIQHQMPSFQGAHLILVVCDTEVRAEYLLTTHKATFKLDNLTNQNLNKCSISCARVATFA